MPPLTGLNAFMISILQRCRTYGADKPVAARDAESDALSLPKGAEVLTNIRGLL